MHFVEKTAFYPGGEGLPLEITNTKLCSRNWSCIASALKTYLTIQYSNESDEFIVRWTSKLNLLFEICQKRHRWTTEHTDFH